MTPEEMTRLEAELAEAREKHHEEFVEWYDTARMTTAQQYCETGWLLQRKIMFDTFKLEPQPTRQVAASVTINAKGGQQGG